MNTKSVGVIRNAYDAHASLSKKWRKGGILGHMEQGENYAF